MPQAKALFSTPCQPKRVVLIGGGGFIGRGLIKLFDQEQISYLSITRQELDLTQPESKDILKSKLQDDDVVIFLSALTPRYGRGIDVFVKNILVAENVCAAVEDSNIAHLLYLSSDAVYPLEGGVTNEASSAEPMDLYGAMHKSREIMVKACTNVPVISLRSTLVYGNGDPHNSYGPNRMRRSASEKQEIPLFGKGEEMRDHILIDDLAKLVLKVIQYRCEGILNLATGKAISYWDLANKVAQLFDSEVTVKTSERHNPITYRHYDVSAIYQLFSDFQFTPLDEGLKQVHEQEFVCAH